MKHLTTDKYPWALRTEYYRSCNACLNDLRFGQWVWNTYGDSSDGSGWPELFYEEDENKVLALLCKAWDSNNQSKGAST